MGTDCDMNTWMRLLEHPLAIYLVIGVFSVLTALLFFRLGGSVAEITGQEHTFAGFSFKAGGGLAGFILIFYISHRFIETLQSRFVRTANLKVYLVGKPDAFDRRDNTYTCIYSLLNEDTGEKQEVKTMPRWEAGFLTIDVLGVGQNHLISLRIENGQKQVWESDFFHSRASKTEVILVT